MLKEDLLLERKLAVLFWRCVQNGESSPAFPHQACYRRDKQCLRQPVI